MSALNLFCVILGMTKRYVAPAAKNSPDLASGMTVIDMATMSIIN